MKSFSKAVFISSESVRIAELYISYYISGVKKGCFFSEIWPDNKLHTTHQTCFIKKKTEIRVLEYIHSLNSIKWKMLPFINVYNNANRIAKIVNEKLFQIYCSCVSTSTHYGPNAVIVGENVFSSVWKDHVTNQKLLYGMSVCLFKNHYTAMTKWKCG